MAEKIKKVKGLKAKMVELLDVALRLKLRLMDPLDQHPIVFLVVSI